RPRRVPGRIPRPDQGVVTLLSDRLDDSTRVRGAVQRSLMLRIKDYIGQRFRDPALGPAEIAAAVSISTRYLHKLFEADRQTVSLYIKGLRLDRARRTCWTRGRLGG